MVVTVPRASFAALVLCAGLVAPRLALAQCPDGTPPPCGPRVRSARVTPPPPAERGRRFLILPFRNLSRSPDLEWLVEGSTTMLGDALGRWREITVVRDDQLYPAMQRNGLASGTVMDPVRVRRVAEQTGGWTAVTGEVLVTGGRVRVSARAYDVVTSRELARTGAEVTAGADVRPAFERIGSALLRTAGLDTASVDLGAATTPSLDAYRAYLRGLAHANRAEYRRAREAFGEAVRLDTTFAQAYYELAYAELFTSPWAAADPRSAINRHVARAVALADRLPARQRDLVLGVGAMFRGRFGAAREILERLVGQDSSDVDAVGWLSFENFVDWILVPDGRGGLIRRGSLNTHLRLAKRVLELNPARHDAYLPLVVTYRIAAGEVPGLIPTFTREAGENLFAVWSTAPARIYMPLMFGDSIALVPIDSVAALPAEVLLAARRRATEAARAWAERWLAAGPTEGEAYRAIARVSELAGDYDAALAQLARADSLGAEYYEDAASSRLVLLGKSGRYAAASRLADSLWTTGRFDTVIALPLAQAEALTWAFHLFLMRADAERADQAVRRFAAGVMTLRMAPDSSLAAGTALALLAGAPSGWPIKLPVAFRVEVMDSLWSRRESLPPDSRVARFLPSLAGFVSRNADADSTLAARARAAPWYRPPQ